MPGAGAPPISGAVIVPAELPVVEATRAEPAEEAAQPSLPAAAAAAAAAHAEKFGVDRMRNFYCISGSYLCFTVSDSSLRVVVVLYTSVLGLNAVYVAWMFSLYELAGVFTNLLGGLLGSRLGLRATCVGALVFQVACCAILACAGTIFPALDPLSRGDPSVAPLDADARARVMFFFMGAQALSGVAKDLIKLSGKSVVKLVIPEGQAPRLFKLVSYVTGAKNAVKGGGYFVGSLLLLWLDYLGSILFLGAGLLLLLVPCALWIDSKLGKTKKAAQCSQLLGKAPAVNWLSLARLWLFACRDVWFEVVVPIYLRTVLHWNAAAVGGFMAGYIILYGLMQTHAGWLVLRPLGQSPPGAAALRAWTAAQALVSAVIGGAFFAARRVDGGAADSPAVTGVLIAGIAVFALVFAVNSAVHSYLILAYTKRDSVAVDVGFYYCANAAGRLAGTLISGYLYEATVAEYGLAAALWASAGLAAASTLSLLPLRDPEADSPNRQ